MKSRIEIKGKKIWKDADNLYNTRPESVTINLLRDEQVYKTVEANDDGDWEYNFGCLPMCKNTVTKYNYRLEEVEVEGHTSKIEKYNVINTVGNVTINGKKIWRDNNNIDGIRPNQITVNLLQNGTVYRTIQVTSPVAGQDTSLFSFSDVPAYDTNGNQYIYTVDESVVSGYYKITDGFNLINSNRVSFSFIKYSSQEKIPVANAKFELRQDATVIQTATSDIDGKVSFNNVKLGNYQLIETFAPDEYMDNDTVYQIQAIDNNVTIDGELIENYKLENVLLTESRLTYYLNNDVHHDTPGIIPYEKTFIYQAYDLVDVLSDYEVFPDYMGLCQFIGWSTKPDSLEVDYYPYDIPIQLAKHTKLYGVWQSCLPNAIKNIYDVDTIIRGKEAVYSKSGVGAQIKAVFPNAVEAVTNVLPDGTWQIPIPGGVVLQPGDRVEMYQIENGKVSTPDIPMNVFKFTAPNLSITSENITNPGTDAKPGDVVGYTINFEYLSTFIEVLKIVNELSDISTFMPNTIKLNGVAINPGTAINQYQYENHTLTVILDIIHQGDINVLTYQVTINAGTVGQEAVNIVDVVDDFDISFASDESRIQIV